MATGDKVVNRQESSPVSLIGPQKETHLSVRLAILMEPTS